MPLKERVDEVIFSLIVRGLSGILSHRSLTDPLKEYKTSFSKYTK